MCLKRQTVSILIQLRSCVDYADLKILLWIIVNQCFVERVLSIATSSNYYNKKNYYYNIRPMMLYHSCEHQYVNFKN